VDEQSYFEEVEKNKDLLPFATSSPFRPLVVFALP